MAGGGHPVTGAISLTVSGQPAASGSPSSGAGTESAPDCGVGGPFVTCCDDPPAPPRHRRLARSLCSRSSCSRSSRFVAVALYITDGAERARQALRQPTGVMPGDADQLARGDVLGSVGLDPHGGRAQPRRVAGGTTSRWPPYFLTSARVPGVVDSGSQYATTALALAPLIVGVATTAPMPMSEHISSPSVGEVPAAHCGTRRAARPPSRWGRSGRPLPSSASSCSRCTGLVDRVRHSDLLVLVRVAGFPHRLHRHGQGDDPQSDGARDAATTLVRRLTRTDVMALMALPRRASVRSLGRPCSTM